MALAELPEGIHQIISDCELSDGRRFPAGDDQAVETVKLLRQAHFARLYAEASEHSNMFCKVALEGQYANFH